MWVEAGFEPDSFWFQTPATFQLIMEGARKRLEASYERELSIAHATAGFTAASQSKGGLKPLRHYMKKDQSPKEMLGLIRSMDINAKITRVMRGKPQT